jgi:hypothetical protein
LDWLERGSSKLALDDAFKWLDEAPDDTLAHLTAGEVLEALGDTTAAARIYGSLVDQMPLRAEMLRYAAIRLQHLRVGHTLAVTLLQRAVAIRPDHINGYRLLAYALLANGAYKDAARALVDGCRLAQSDARQRSRFTTLMAHELSSFVSIWKAKRPGLFQYESEPLTSRMASAPQSCQVSLNADASGTGPKRSLMAFLSWENDESDVDVSVTDAHGHTETSKDPLNRAVSGVLREMARKTGSPTQESPGEGNGSPPEKPPAAVGLDVRSGYGPDVLHFDRAEDGYPYAFEARVRHSGPFGIHFGYLHIVQIDEKGRFAIEVRPFVIDSSSGAADLGQLKGSLL